MQKSRTQIKEIVIPELEPFVGKTTHNHWSDHETEVLRRYYNRVPVKQLAEYLRRSIASVQCKARMEGVQGEERIQENYNNATKFKM